MTRPSRGRSRRWSGSTEDARAKVDEPWDILLAGAVPLALTIEEIVYAAAGVCLALFAGWIVILSPRHRATRALALLLLGITHAWTLRVFGELAPATIDLYLVRSLPIGIVMIGLATIYFLCVYPRPRGWIGRSRWGGWAVLAGGVALCGLLLARPELYVDHELVGGEVVFRENGPLVFITNTWTITIGVMLILFAVDVTRTPRGPMRRALLLVLAGFIVSMMVWPLSLFLNDVTGRLDGAAIADRYERIGYAIDESTVAFSFIAVAIVAVHAWRSKDPAERREGSAFAILAIACVAVTLVLTFAFPPPARDEWTSPAQGIGDALASLAIAAFAGYALLKHRLFDLDVKLRWTISRGAVAAVFLAIFFIAAQLAQNFLSDTYGWMMGGVIAGVMLFAIAPIQRMAERVAVAAVPAATAGEDRRMEVYRLALALALSDRAITRDEERHLAKLAEELGVSHTEALAAREAMERDLGIAA